jgi:dienelactone hydrolase
MSNNYYFQETSFEFETRTLLGDIHYGAGDIGEAMTVIQAIEDGNDLSWVTEWQTLAERIEDIAEKTYGDKHYVSAGDAYLRASSYYGAAMVAIDGLDNPEDTLAFLFGAHRRCFDAHVNLLPVPAQRVEIAYQSSTLPGYLFRPSDDGQPRPTLIVNNGSDAPLTVLHPSMVQPGLARGYNVLLFDGPGQQSMLFQHNVPFRHDWEHVITPIVDHLLERADVDPDRLAIYGISQGGYWVPRALAFEHRLAAAVVDPGVDDVTTSWRLNMPPGGLKLFEAGDEQGFNSAMDALIDKLGPKFRQTVNWRCKPYGRANVYQTFKAVEQYRLGDLVKQIRTPMLVTDPEGEQFWPGQAQRLYDELPGPATHMPFTAAEGAGMHIEPMARSLVAQRMFDWLDDTLCRA